MASNALVAWPTRRSIARPSVDSSIECISPRSASSEAAICSPLLSSSRGASGAGISTALVGTGAGPHRLVLRLRRDLLEQVLLVEALDRGDAELLGGGIDRERGEHLRIGDLRERAVAQVGVRGLAREIGERARVADVVERLAAR